MKNYLIIGIGIYLLFKIFTMFFGSEPGRFDPVRALKSIGFESDGFDPVTEFKSELCNSSMQKVDSSKLKGKTTLLYFSAKWCPPCQQFTPILVKFQRKHRDKVEVVFISSDKSKSEMSAYIKSKRMNAFYCVDFNSPLKGALGKQFKVRGIPSVVVISPSGKVASMNGRDHIYRSQQLPDEWTQ